MWQPTKWFMHKPECGQENETNKTLCNFGEQTDHLTPARLLTLVLINKKKRTYHLVV